MRKVASLLVLVGTLSIGCSSIEGPGGPGSTNPDYLTPGEIPGKPQLDSLVPGDGTILVYFTGGGSHFRSVCSAASSGTYAATGYTSKSPDTVKGLQNGTEYSCSVTGFSPSEKPGPTSSSLKATPRAP